MNSMVDLGSCQKAHAHDQKMSPYYLIEIQNWNSSKSCYSLNKTYQLNKCGLQKKCCENFVTLTFLILIVTK